MLRLSRKCASWRLFVTICLLHVISWVLLLRTQHLNASQTVDGEIHQHVSEQVLLPAEIKLSRCNPKNLGHLNVSDIAGRLAELTALDEFRLMSSLLDAGLAYGGTSSPVSNCRPAHNVAIIVPYRNRPDQLRLFVRYMHPFLQNQLLKYAVFVVEQADDLPFNRGALLNVGFAEGSISQHDPPFDCFIFHDVDLLPEDGRNLYSCPEDGKPRQLAYVIDIYDFKPVQRGYAGGVTAITSKDFVRVNGFSNDYWGWGSEDDDFSRRLSIANMTLLRASDSDPAAIRYAKYRTLYHPKEPDNPYRGDVFTKKATLREMLSDGLTSLKYKRKAIASTIYYTHIIVEFETT